MTPPRARAGTPTRTIVWVTLGAVAFVAAVVLLYDRGLLPIAGIFVAMAVGPLIVFWRRAGLARRRARLAQAVLDGLAQVVGLVDAERRTPDAERATGASTPSLLDADELARRAVQRFAWGDEDGAAAAASELVAHVRGQAWRDAPLTRAVASLEPPLADLAVVLGKLEVEAARGRADDGR